MASLCKAVLGPLEVLFLTWLPLMLLMWPLRPRIILLLNFFVGKKVGVATVGKADEGTVCTAVVNMF